MPDERAGAGRSTDASAPGLRTDAPFAEYTIAADVDLRTGIAAVTGAIEAARDAGATRLLVDLRPLIGLEPPWLGQRYSLASEWARAARGRLSIAIVVPENLVDPRRYGVQVAHGSGLDTDVFEDYEAARAWLARRPPPESHP